MKKALLVLALALAACGPSQADRDARDARDEKVRMEIAEHEMALCRTSGGTPSFYSTQDPNWGGRRIFVTCEGGSK